MGEQCRTREGTPALEPVQQKSAQMIIGLQEYWYLYIIILIYSELGYVCICTNVQLTYHHPDEVHSRSKDVHTPNGSGEFLPA